MQLLYLRQSETHYALSKKFDQAKSYKSQADALQKQETIMARERAQAAMRTSYQKLQLKQRKEIDCMRQKNEARIRDIESERDKKVAASLIVVRRLENAQAIMPQTVHRTARQKPIKDAYNMKSLQTSLDVRPQHMRSVIRRKKQDTQKKTKKRQDDDF